MFSKKKSIIFDLSSLLISFPPSSVLFISSLVSSPLVSTFLVSSFHFSSRAFSSPLLTIHFLPLSLHLQQRMLLENKWRVNPLV